MQEAFTTVYWSAWNSDATFAPGEQLPPESEGRLWAVLAFVFYGDKVALADIEGRGLCIPSGKIEPGETLDAAMAREAWEETGATLHPEHRRLIGCYRLTPRGGAQAGQTRYCPVFVAEAWGFAPIPPGSESRGLVLAAWEDVAEVYFTWDVLMAAVFEYAEERKNALFSAGVPISAVMG
ncbi:MAG: NUDIX domain-containing protein [Armatimonadota bacterium]|nr:NUDIX domain-containing protein [Armatimonadota bacterium]